MDSTKSLWATVMQQPATKDQWTAQDPFVSCKMKPHNIKPHALKPDMNTDHRARSSRRYVCLLRSSQVFSKNTDSKRSTQFSDLCTLSWLMGLFIIIFGILPEAKTEDRCFGVPLNETIIEAACLYDWSVREAHRCWLSSLSSLQTYCWPSLKWFNKSGKIFSVLQT